MRRKRDSSTPSRRQVHKTKQLGKRERQRPEPGDDDRDPDVAPRQPAPHLTQFGANSINFGRRQRHAHGPSQIHPLRRERRARLRRADAVQLPQFREELPQKPIGARLLAAPRVDGLDELPS